MINTNYICCWDLETSSLSEVNGEVVQIAAIMIDPHTLDFVENSLFNSLVKPVNILSGTEAQIQEKWQASWRAWEVNKKTRKELEKAPLPGHVWKAFADYVKKYNVGGYTGKPIQTGHNIQDFDIKWLMEAGKTHKFLVDKQGRQNLFHSGIMLDTRNVFWMWFDHVNDTPDSLSMDVIRPYMGISNDGFHDAKADIMITGEFLIRFLKLHRHFGPKVKFKGSFTSEPTV